MKPKQKKPEKSANVKKKAKFKVAGGELTDDDLTKVAGGSLRRKVAGDEVEVDKRLR